MESQHWKIDGLAEELAAKIIKNHGTESQEAHQARLALMVGKAKFRNFSGVLQIYEEIKANNGQLPIAGYNALLMAKANE